MKLQGVSIDFDDRKTCGLLPKLCLNLDFHAEELADNEELQMYWESNRQEVLKRSTNVVSGNIGTKSILYSGDKSTIQLIRSVFKELTVHSVGYDEINQCEECLDYDYIKLSS